jgi:hypothetical protein
MSSIITLFELMRTREQLVIIQNGVREMVEQ